MADNQKFANPYSQPLPDPVSENGTQGGYTDPNQGGYTVAPTSTNPQVQPNYADPNAQVNQSYDPYSQPTNYDPNQYPDPAQSPYPQAQETYNQNYADPNYVDPNAYQDPQYNPNQTFQAAPGNAIATPEYIQSTQQPSGVNNPQQPQNKKNKIIAFFSKWWVIAITVLVVLAIALGAYFVATQPSINILQKNYDNVEATVSGESSLAQSSPGTWEVLIENKEDVPLRNVVIELEFDRDFQYLREINPSPSNPEGNIYEFSRLDPFGSRGSTAKIAFEGVLVGNVDVEPVMQGTVTFSPELADGTLGSTQSISITPFKTKITSPEIEVLLTPTQEQVRNGGEAEFTATIKNTTDKELRDLRFRMIYPDGQDTFTYTSSEYIISNTSAPITQPDSDSTWIIDRISGGSEQTIKVRGRVFGANDARVVFGAELGVKTSGNEYRTIREVRKDISIIAQPVVLSSVIQGKDSIKLFKPGETLTLKIDYQNQSNQTLNNVEITSFIDDPAQLLDLSTIRFSGGERGDILGSNITWKGTRVPQLVTLRPQQKGTLLYEIKVKDEDTFLNTNLDQTEYTLRPGVQVRAQNLEQLESAGELYKAQGKLIFTQPEEPVEKGINPTTSRRIYNVTWTLETTQNQVTGVVVKSTSPLPPGSFIENSIRPLSAINSLSYNEQTGEITWTPGELQSYTGITSNKVEISFDLEVEQSESGTILRAPTATGKDVFTGEDYEITLQELRA